MKYRVIVAVLFISVFFLSFIAAKKPDKEYIKTEITIKEQDYKKTVFEMIDELPFKYPEIVKAQAVLESGNFKSPVFKINNNVFGMRLAMSRLTTATGSNLNHATYNNLQEAIIDRLLYETKYLHGLSRAEYLRYLDKVYAEAGGYDKVLEKVIKQNKL
jgi:uncharacterized FlgJ-related protein